MYICLVDHAPLTLFTIVHLDMKTIFGYTIYFLIKDYTLYAKEK